MKTLQEFYEAVQQQMKAMRRLLDRLLPVIDESPHDARQAQLQRVDELRGDYKHRQHGKRPVPSRFRQSENAAVPFSEQNHRKLNARLHREKADLRKGRRNNNGQH